LSAPAPKISIVTPSFNQAEFIERNIRSVLDQGYGNLEHLVVDGGSTDGTIDILKKYPHLTWSSEKDRGQTHALNKGFRRASGEIIGWLNSDDTYNPGTLATVVAAFGDPGVDVVYGDGYETGPDDEIIREYHSRGVSVEGLVKYWKWKFEFVQPSFFFRRSVFSEVGFLDESLFYVMDIDFFIRLCRRYRLHYIQQPLANLRMHDRSKTGTVYRKIIPNYIWEMQKVSYRNWGGPSSASYYGYALSFAGAILYSLVKNLLFFPGSKSRDRLAGKL